MSVTGREDSMSKPGGSSSPPADDVNDGLVRLLECPVCAEQMTDKIFICRNGHNVCSTCRPRLGGSCPTCRGELTETRCLLAETIALHLLYPCDYGCGRKLPLREKRRHEARCPFRLRDCEHAARGCTKKTPLDDMKDHEARCPYRRYECPNTPEGCSAEVVYKDRKRHDAHCPYRTCVCRNSPRGCDHTFHYKEKKEHEEACLYRLVDCENCDDGCKEKLLFKDKVTHEAVCPHRLYDCVPCKPDGCKWRGRRRALEKHMSEDHRIAVWRNKSNLGVWCDYDSSTDRRYAGLVVVYGELFWYNHKFNSRSGRCSWTVQYVGAKEKCERFKYRLTIYADEKSGPSVTFDDVPVASDTDSVDEVFETAHGVCLDASMLEKYVVDKSMRIKFKIKKIK